MEGHPRNYFLQDGIQYIKLRNGTKMPVLGLGTSHSGGYSHEAVVYAIKECNYRLIDTAKRYGCEKQLGLAIEESQLLREDLFLTTKLWPTDYGVKSVREAFTGSAKRLNIEYLDLYMLHWPVCPSLCLDKKQLLEDTWRTMELLYDEGLCRSIGVCNYEISHLVDMLENCSVIPHVNQIELNPYHNPVGLKEFCQDLGILVEGYCPLGKGSLVEEKAIKKIAQKYRRTPAQILIRWSIQVGAVTIPKSTKPSRVKENGEVFDFEIAPEDMIYLGSLHDGRRAVEIDRVQEKIDSNLPDGYKLLASSRRIHS